MSNIVILKLLQYPFAYFITFILTILLSLVIHEYCHAWMATRLGDYTAKYKGRLTLNPSKHLDPLGTAFFLIFGVGWAKPVPTNFNALKGRYDELKVALAGPASNLIIATIFMIPYQIITTIIGTERILATNLLEMIIGINLLLAVFNLIPIHPLDGSHILKALLQGKTRYSWEIIERQLSNVLLILIILAVFTPLNPLSFISQITAVLSGIIGGAINIIIQAVIFVIHLF